jgi:hypothetical protein
MMANFKFYLLFTLLSLALMGCGKKAQEENTSSRQSEPQQASELEALLNQQELFCGSERSCPTYITKIAVLNKGKLKFCTGFLVENNIVATATSCLPERLRSKYLPCDKEVFFFFAQTNEKPQRVGCKKVIDVAEINSEEPFLWRSNVSYLELNSSDRRRTASPVRTGMSDLDHFYVWSVDQIDDQQGIIRKSEDCQSVHLSYFNPLANHEYSPVMTLAGCEFSAGNAGAPVFDYRGKVRAIVSSPIDEKHVSEVSSMRILEKPLKKMMHVSNYACAPMIPFQEVASERECTKPLDYSSYDQARREMINEMNLFKTSIQKIETNINNKNRYLKLEVKLNPADDSYIVEVFPKCFKNISSWIGEFTGNKPFTFNVELPNMKLRSSMNEYGRMMALEFSRAGIPTNFQFKPSILRSNKQTTVYMWSDGPTLNFPNLSDKCDSLF